MRFGEMELGKVTREIPLPCGRAAIVPESEFERLSKHRWYWNKSKKIVRSERNAERGAISLHREVLRAPEDLQVEAIDGNYLNCTFGNLQLGRPKPRPWEDWERHIIEGMNAVGRTNVEIAQELGNGRTAVGVRMALKRWKDNASKVKDSREAWKQNPGTYRSGPRGKAWHECFNHPIVHVDVVTGEVLAWELERYQSIYV